MQDVCSLLGITKYNTTAYHPQCNGLTGRFIRTLKTMIQKHAVRFGAQWDRYIHGVLWAYRNTKPSFLLYGIDCRYSTESAFLPPSDVDPADPVDYQQELMLARSSARELAAEAIRGAQDKYKTNYDKKRQITNYRVGDWVLIRFPQDEYGTNHKLSRPWHGPFRVKESSSTGVTAVKVYFPEQNPIQVDQSRVSHCPEGFPPGWFWYGGRRSGPGHPPKWIEQVLQEPNPETATLSDGCAGRQEISGPESLTSEPEESCGMTGDMSVQISQREVPQPLPEPKISQDSGVQLTEDSADIEMKTGRALARSGTNFSKIGLSSTRTRKVKPTDRLMTVHSGRALLRPRSM